MNILFACSELHPLIKTGGLADVACYLPQALQRTGQSVRIILPAYASVMAKVGAAQRVATCTVYGHAVEVLETTFEDTGMILYLVDCPAMFGRGGGPYGDDSDNDWPDNAQRFGLFCEVVAELALNRLGLTWQPDTVHCNDWQTGLVPVLLAAHTSRPGSVFTIHNLAYQGLFPQAEFDKLALPATVRNMPLWDFRGLEFHSQLSFIKGGIVFSDAVNTVSPGYAQEVLTPEFGCGLGGLLRHCGKRFSGILNGIDTGDWDPATDTAIIASYDQHSLADKQKNKRALMIDFNLPTNGEVLLLGMVSRLTEQKGIDLLLDSLPLLLKLPVKLVVLGSGDSVYEKALQEHVAQYPAQISIRLGFDEALAHSVIAGVDALLIPSRYEPCGLTQMYSQRYGTVPIAHGVGGLQDTIVDVGELSPWPGKSTGLLFHDFTVTAFIGAVSRAVDSHSKRNQWRHLQLTGMGKDFSWAVSAREYVDLYRAIGKEI